MSCTGCRMAALWRLEVDALPMKHHSRSATFSGKSVVLVFLLLSLLGLGACRERPRPVDRMGPPWNALQMRERAAEFTAADAPAPTPLPAENKELGYADCVVTAAQHAPDLINSVISLDMAELDSESAFWKRLPSIRALFRVNTNLTNKYEEYQGTSARLTLGVYGFEPVVSYFTHKSTLLMQDIALYTHEIALEKRAWQIGEVLINLESKENDRKHLLGLLEIARRSKEYQSAKEGSEANRLEQAKALHQERKIQAELEKADIAVAAHLSSLKVMLGLDQDRTLAVRSGDVGALLRREKAAAVFADYEWEPVWADSPEARITRTAHQLSRENITVAWARYLPDFAFDIYAANPDNDYASYSSKDDVFFSLMYSLPLWDWGERYRGVERARLGAVQASQRLKLSRLKFAGEWKAAWQDLKLAEAEVDVAKHMVAAARLDEQKARLEFQSGQIQYPLLATAEEDRIRGEMLLEEAVCTLRQQELSAWILSGGFRRSFLDPGALERAETKGRGEAESEEGADAGGNRNAAGQPGGGGTDRNAAGQREAAVGQAGAEAGEPQARSAVPGRPDGGRLPDEAWGAAAQGLNAPEQTQGAAGETRVVAELDKAAQPQGTAKAGQPKKRSGRKAR